MNVISKLRSIIHRNLVVSAMRFYYVKFYGMNLGENVRISTGARLDKTNPKGVNIGEGTAVTSGAAVLTHDFVMRAHRDTYIGKNCFLGYGCIILPGVKIGDSVIVTPNTVVGRDTPSNSVVMGNPGRIVEKDIVTGPWGIRLDKGNSSPIS